MSAQLRGLIKSLKCFSILEVKLKAQPAHCCFYLNGRNTTIVNGVRNAQMLKVEHPEQHRCWKNSAFLKSIRQTSACREEGDD